MEKVFGSGGSKAAAGRQRWAVAGPIALILVLAVVNLLSAHLHFKLDLTKDIYAETMSKISLADRPVRGNPDAKVTIAKTCSTACVLILAGGIHRTIDPDTRVVLSGMEVRSRRAPNISDVRRSALTLGIDYELRTYLRDMGVETEVMDIVDQDSGLKRNTPLLPADWERLHLITPTSH